MVSTEKDDENANKSPDALKKVGDKAPPYTDATRPLSTPELALKKVGDKAPPDTDATNLSPPWNWPLRKLVIKLKKSSIGGKQYLDYL